MPFFGKETESSEAEGSRPLRKWEYTDIEGFDRFVEGHYLRFEADHVTFWRDRPEPNVQDTLILAELSTSVLELKEVIA